MEQHDEWQLQHRNMQLEALRGLRAAPAPQIGSMACGPSMAELAPPANDAEPLQLPPRAARPMATADPARISTT
jgi:hypothetical protein